MELWFIFALITILFAGLHVFMQKVGAMHGYNSSFLNSIAAAVSATIGFIVVIFLEGFSELSLPMIGVAAASGSIYIIGSNLRMDALRYVDSTIFFPLHKFISPLIALVLGVMWFQEVLSLKEFIGILLGLFVPLLLITKAEHARQRDLRKGISLMIISATMAALAAATNKYGTNIFESILLFAAIAQSITALVGIIIYRMRNTAKEIHKQTKNPDKQLFVFGITSGLFQYITFTAFLLTFYFGGMLSVAYTIQSFYILIPIILSIIFFKEHWNTQKVIAIALSLVALVLMR